MATPLTKTLDAPQHILNARSKWFRAHDAFAFGITNH
jgi:hypothetical protein